jgi:hypothetical protein
MRTLFITTFILDMQLLAILRIIGCLCEEEVDFCAANSSFRMNAGGPTAQSLLIICIRKTRIIISHVCSYK